MTGLSPVPACRITARPGQQKLSYRGNAMLLLANGFKKDALHFARTILNAIKAVKQTN